MTSFFFLPRVVRFGSNFADWCRMTCRLRWCVEMETICIIPIWRTFGRIQWHVIPQPRVTLQGAATWWIHCHDSRARCHIAGCSHLMKSMPWSCHIAGCKNSIGHIENILFLMQFRIWRAAAFVSSPIHLLVTSPEMSYKTGQMSVGMSVRPCGANIFKTLMLRDRWADVDETWHVYSTGLVTELLGNGILNFGRMGPSQT